MAGKRKQVEEVKTLKKVPGVYIIQDFTNKKAYVGSSIDLASRLKQQMLKNSKYAPIPITINGISYSNIYQAHLSTGIPSATIYRRFHKGLYNHV